MNTKEEILDFLKANKQDILKRYHLTKIGLFGSFARNQQTSLSDVDVLIEIEENTKNIHDLKIDLNNYLSQMFDRSVDIAREKYLKPYAKDFILKDTIYV